MAGRSQRMGWRRSLRQRWSLPVLAAAALGASTAAHALPDEISTYIVFFEWDRATLDPAAIEVLNSAMLDYGDRPNMCFAVTGHSDRANTAPYNLQISRRRAESVRDYLTQRGISDSMITVQARGDRDLALPTPQGERAVENRRVEVAVSPCPTRG